MGIPTHQAKSTLIVGGGTIAYYLAKQLLEMRVDVRIIEQNKERCEMLSEQLPEATILQGDGTDKEFLLEEGLMHTDSFVALTNMDEENLMLALLARKYSNAKLIAKVNRIHFEEVVDELDIDSVIYPKNLAADHIVRYTRAMQNSLGSNVETLYKILDGQAEALEFVIREESEVTGIPLMNLNLKNNLLIGMHQPRRQYQDRAWTGLHPAGRYSDRPDESERSAGYPRHPEKVGGIDELFDCILYHRLDPEFEAAFMVLPTVVALIYRESEVWCFSGNDGQYA